MGKLIYTLNVSLDGYVETPDHSLDWTIVDEELHSWFNDRAGELQASIYGRRMYELMSGYWPTAQSDASATRAMREFGQIWLDTPKIVFSSSLEHVEWNSRLVRGGVAEEFARLRSEFEGDIEIGGPTLAGSFIRAGLVDEFQMLVHPVAIGAGTPFFPARMDRTSLHLVNSHVFKSGVTYLGYTRS